MALLNAVAALRCQLKDTGCTVPEDYKLRRYLERAALEVQAATGCPCGCKTVTETYIGDGSTRLQLRGCCVKRIKSVYMADAPHFVPFPVREGYSFVLDRAGGLCKQTSGGGGGCCIDLGGACCTSVGWPKGCRITVTYEHGREPEPGSLLECGLVDVAENVANADGCKPSGPKKAESIGDWSVTYAVVDDTSTRIVSGRFVDTAAMAKIGH